MTHFSELVSRIEQGDSQAAEQLFPLVYDELRRLAAAKLAAEKPGETLQATDRQSKFRTAASCRSRKRRPGTASRTLLRSLEPLEARMLLTGAPLLETAGGKDRDYVFDMARDQAGNTIIAGQFSNSITFAAGQANETTLTGRGTEGYVAKYAPDGSPLWTLPGAGKPRPRPGFSS